MERVRVGTFLGSLVPTGARERYSSSGGRDLEDRRTVGPRDELLRLCRDRQTRARARTHTHTQTHTQREERERRERGDRDRDRGRGSSAARGKEISFM